MSQRPHHPEMLLAAVVAISVIIGVTYYVSADNRSADTLSDDVRAGLAQDRTPYIAPFKGEILQALRPTVASVHKFDRETLEALRAR